MIINSMIFGSGSAEEHYAIIHVHNDDLAFVGTDVTLTHPDATTTTVSIPSDGIVNFTVLTVGDYTVTYNGSKTKSTTVSADDLINKVTKDVNIEDVTIVSWANGTDEQIVAMLNAHYKGSINVGDYWAVGDVRSVSLSAMSATGVSESHAAQTVELVIIGIEHDTLATAQGTRTKAAITIHMKNCLKETGYMNSGSVSYTNGKWSTSKRRTWIQNVFEKALPSWLQTALKPVTKSTCEAVSGGNSSLVSSTERCFMVSNWEIFGAAFSTYCAAQDGNQYEYYKTQSNRGKSVNGSNDSWWSRSGFSIATSSTSYPYFVNCSSSGSASYTLVSSGSGLALGLAL